MSQKMVEEKKKHIYLTISNTYFATILFLT